METWGWQPLKRVYHLPSFDMPTQKYKKKKTNDQNFPSSPARVDEQIEIIARTTN